jgi:hypothetical protein
MATLSPKLPQNNPSWKQRIMFKIGALFSTFDRKILYLFCTSTCPQNLIPTRHIELWGKHHFAQRGMLKFTYKGRFLTIKRHMRNYCNENPNGNSLVPLLRLGIFLKKNTKILNFGGISKFLKLIVSRGGHYQYIFKTIYDKSIFYWGL